MLRGCRGCAISLPCLPAACDGWRASGAVPAFPPGRAQPKEWRQGASAELDGNRPPSPYLGDQLDLSRGKKFIYISHIWSHPNGYV